MDIIYTKLKFLALVERERARTDRTGNDFSVITFNIHTLKKNKGRENTLGDLFIKNTRNYDDIGSLEKNCFAILCPDTSGKQAQKVADRLCSTLIPESLNPISTVITSPFHEDPGTQESAKNTATETSGTIPHLTAWANTYGSLIHQLKIPTTQMPPWKRIIDIIGAAAGLLLLLPVCMLIAAYIKSFSPGPALFTQKRVGYLGKTFMCFKFRTMHINATTSVHNNYIKKLTDSETPMEKLDNYDPRIIPHGRLLRKSGLDELPQLLNVLLGDMSLIGPRPCIPYEAEQYKQWQLKRFEAVPGLSGLWQVNGKNKTTFNTMMRYDIRYGLKKNIIMDTDILLKTLPAVIKMVMERKTEKDAGMIDAKVCALEK